jgi:hypothetical protein
MKYAYDYRNRNTSGWVRGSFEDFSQDPADHGEALNALEAVARAWPNGTDLRVVEIDDEGKETFGAARVKGSRGPLPSDRQTS